MTRSIKCILSLAISCFTLFNASTAHAQASFQGLGDLPGGHYSSTAMDVSPDGSTVVGDSTPLSGGEAFRWTEAGGMQPLGCIPPAKVWRPFGPLTAPLRSRLVRRP